MFRNCHVSWWTSTIAWKSNLKNIVRYALDQGGGNRTLKLFWGNWAVAGCAYLPFALNRFWNCTGTYGKIRKGSVRQCIDYYQHLDLLLRKVYQRGNCFIYDKFGMIAFHSWNQSKRMLFLNSYMFLIWLVFQKIKSPDVPSSL